MPQIYASPYTEVLPFSDYSIESVARSGYVTLSNGLVFSSDYLKDPPQPPLIDTSGAVIYHVGNEMVVARRPKVDVTSTLLDVSGSLYEDWNFGDKTVNSDSYIDLSHEYFALNTIMSGDANDIMLKEYGLALEVDGTTSKALLKIVGKPNTNKTRRANDRTTDSTILVPAEFFQRLFDVDTKAITAPTQVKSIEQIKEILIDNTNPAWDLYYVVPTIGAVRPKLHGRSRNIRMVTRGNGIVPVSDMSPSDSRAYILDKLSSSVDIYRRITNSVNAFTYVWAKGILDDIDTLVAEIPNIASVVDTTTSMGDAPQLLSIYLNKVATESLPPTSSYLEQTALRETLRDIGVAITEFGGGAIDMLMSRLTSQMTTEAENYLTFIGKQHSPQLQGYVMLPTSGGKFQYGRNHFIIPSNEPSSSINNSYVLLEVNAIDNKSTSWLAFERPGLTGNPIDTTVAAVTPLTPIMTDYNIAIRPPGVEIPLSPQDTLNLNPSRESVSIGDITGEYYEYLIVRMVDISKGYQLYSSMGTTLLYTFNEKQAWFADAVGVLETQIASAR